MPPLKSNFVKGQDVTAAFINELAEAANNALSQEDADATYVRSVNGVPVDPETGNVNVSGGGGSGISLTDDGTGMFTINSGSTGLTDDGTGLFTIGA